MICYRYHVEIFKDPQLPRLQHSINAYLEEVAELNASVDDVRLQWLDDEYHAVVLLALPENRGATNAP